jgi:hypothetical protein
MEPPKGRGPRLSGRQAIGFVVVALVTFALVGLVLGYWTVWIDLG